MLSGPAAFPGLSFESCFATPLTVMIMSGIFGKLYFLGRTAQQDDVTWEQQALWMPAETSY